MRHTRRTLILCSGLAILASACGRKEGSTADTTAGVADTGMPSMGPSGMAGMDHGTASDADHGFLRMMSDHHEALVAMTSAVAARASTDQARSDAQKLQVKQGAERDSMVAMIRSMYGESYVPTVPASSKATNDSLQALSGPAYDRKFYSSIVQHHREGIAMMDSMMTSLTKEPVKAMARKMKADQQREITEFQAKARG